MPQFEPASFPPQLFWLAIAFALLFIAMWRYALPKLSDVLGARQERIAGDLDKATALKEEADQILAEYETALAEARDRANTAIKQAAEAMAVEAAQRHEAFGQALATKAKQAEARIAAAKEQALADLKAVAGEVAGIATAKLIGVVPAQDAIRQAVEAAVKNRA